MDEPEGNMSTEDIKCFGSPPSVKTKPKKRSLVERELETSLTAVVTSPVTTGEGMSTSRYGRARRIKNDSEYLHKKLSPEIKSPRTEKSPTKSHSPVYKMHASNSPLKTESPKKLPSETYLENQIESIYQENISLSRFSSEEVTNPSSGKKFPKVYIRKDLIQTREAEETIVLIKNMFSPTKSSKKKSNTHLNNVLERSEQYSLGSEKPKNGYLDTSSVVKTLDFDSKRIKKEIKDTKNLSKSELFDLEAKCPYQVGDLAWARMGTYPFWPSIVTRDPTHSVFVKKKLFGRIERDVIHVTFFGDNGRRGWIVDNMLRKYMGQLEFESARENVTPEDKKKDPRLYAAYFVSEKKQALWNTSVEEAEMLLREPKRLRIDIFNDMLEKFRGTRPRPSKVGKITRTDSDVSLSESLYDSLFSEDDGKTDNTERSRNMSRNKSLDVSDVVTACLDNMAAKSGITKIQRQSHMDRWLQKAKSKTPEKIQVPVKVEKERSSNKKNKKTPCKEVRVQSVYSLRRSNCESKNLSSFQNEHDYSINTRTDSVNTDNKFVAANGFVVTKVERDKSQNDSDVISPKIEGGTSESQVCKSIDANNTIECTGSLDGNKVTGQTETTGSIDVKQAKMEKHTGTIDSKEIKAEVPDITIIDYKEPGIEVPTIGNFLSEQMDVPKESPPSTSSNYASLDDRNEDMCSRSQGEIKYEFVANNHIDNTSKNEDMTACNKSIEEREYSRDLKSEDSEIKDEESFKIDRDDVKMETEHVDDAAVEKKNMTFDYDSDSSAPLPYSPLSVDLNKDKSRLEDLAELMTDQGWNEPEIPNKQFDDNTPETCLNNNLNSLEEYKNMISDFNNHAREICDNYENKLSTGKFISSLNKNLTQKNDSVSKPISVLDVVNDSDLLEQESNKPSTRDRVKRLNQKTIKNANLVIEPMHDHMKKRRDENEVSDIADSKMPNVKKDKIIDLTIPVDNNIGKPTSNSKKKSTLTKMVNGTVADDREPKLNLMQDEYSNVSQNIKENGYHETNKYKADYDVETASIHPSENVESISEHRRKLRSRDKKPENPLDNPEFVKYMELRQDAIIDENPELSEKEIVAYLHKTWLYEENLKTDTKKNDDLLHQNLVKGLNKGPARTARKKVLQIKINPLNFYAKSNARDATKEDKIIFKKEINVSDDSDVNNESKRNSKDSGIDKKNNSIGVTKSSPRIRNKNKDSAVKLKVDSPIDIKPIIVEDSQDSKANNDFVIKPEADSRINENIATTDDTKDSGSSLSNAIRDSALNSAADTKMYSHLKNDERKHSKASLPKKNDFDVVSISSDSTLDKYTENVEPKDKMDVISLDSADFDDEKYIGPTIFSEVKHEVVQDKNRDIDGDSIDSEDSEAPLITCKLRLRKSNSKDLNETTTTLDTIKKEIESDVISINSEDSDLPLARRKKKKTDKRTLDDPEFVKYLELRQDALIDENPQLTSEEIVNYLYQTWLYEESSKSDLKKSDELEQSGLVKGLDDNVKHTKKIKRTKIKTEKEIIDDDVTPKEKPKRKIIKACYNEEYSDIEEEIEYFEIFKSKHKVLTPKVETDGGEKVEEEDVIEVYDDVELYFEDLTKPKPNVFKGLIREKVCEICEKTINLVKCKGCNGMFHVDCVAEEPKVIEVQAPTRGRKKKKKAGRKPKSLEDSENHEDGSDQNASLEEIEIESQTFDAEVLENELANKMKEIMENTQVEYDSYSSDDGLDWKDTVPGKCEIIDIKLKPRHSQMDYSDFKCKNCQKYDTPLCFVCKRAVSKSDVAVRQKCHVAHCNKYYHLECLDHWPQTQFNGGEPSRNNKKINEYFEAIACPRHVCHTCVSDDPRGCKTRFSGDKLAKCVRCPATYHSFTKCLPAGTQILTASHIICPRHYEHRPGKIPCHVNTGWCFICALGGSLICCEYCPTSFHAECLNIKPPEGGYMCEDCETGRLPLYGEMVWVKLGHYRWWPGIVLHPTEIPENIMAVKHSPGEFVVRFFGQYDHYWVNRGRVFPFQEGDSGRISSQKSKIDAAFTTAMEHAQRACEILKTAQPNDEESLDIASSLLPPHYVKLKVNKPCGSLCGRRLEDPESSLTQCECNPLDEDPCGPYSQCLNRMLLTECGPTCRAADRCNNRAFEKRLYPKLVPYRTPSRGWGLKTLEVIRAGQFVIEYVGELLDEEEFKRRMARMHEMRDENFYFLTLDKERMIDAGPKGNLARFMNHCCEPNCETQKWTVLGDVRVGLFALYDIPANSEVTFNYNLECAGIDKKRCMCGAKRCSGYIGAKPKQDDQSKKAKLPGKRTYNKKRKNTEESPSTSENKPKRPKGRPPKPRELTEIEKDLLIIKNATNGLSSDESSRSLSLESDRNPMKRKRVSFSSEEVVLYNSLESPSTKKHKPDSDNCVGD